jgi:L-ascorbate metabolism protein UlaG (beta-lactamase superfamily)
MQLTYLGHSAFQLISGEVDIILDPFITPNPLASAIDVSSLRCKHIFLSHGHGDHVADAESIGKNSKATIVSNYEVAAWFGAKDLAFHPMNTGGTWDFGTFKAQAVNAVHSSSLPDGSYGGNPLGFVFEIAGRNIYYSGDTALTLDMQLISRRHRIDAAVLCLGGNFTMDVEDALECAKMLGTKLVIGMHFDTFPYIKIDHEQAKALFNKAGIELILPSIGQTITIE